MVGQHIHGSGKRFKWIGSPRGCELWGQHLFKAGGKKLVITEGEIDAMTVFQVNGGWPVVSLPNGVQSAVRAIKDNLEYISSFTEIVLMFDMDQPGQDAAKDVAELLPPGKALIASLPFNDANECLLNNNSKAVVDASWQAVAWSPDEIMHISQVKVDTDSPQEVWEYPWDAMTTRLLGQKSGELILWCSGTGSGKSTILRQVARHHLVQGRSLGMIMLEESPIETKEDLLSLQMGKPVRLVRQQRELNELRIKMGKQPIGVISA